MHVAGRMAAALALAALVAPAVAAQEQAKVCEGLHEVAPGEWASYDVTGEVRPTLLRVAVVGSEHRGDTTLYWIEIGHTSADSAHDVVVQLLVDGFGTESLAVRGLVVKFGAQPALRMPEQMVPAMAQRLPNNAALDAARRCAGAQVVGWETVAVPAGSLRALHLRDADEDVWLSPSVKPMEVVKLVPKQGGGLVLTGYGADARSAIAEPPIELPGGTAGQP